MSGSGTISVVEVARAAGVSVGTVSRVINHHPTVLPVNVEAVRKAMATLGYEPPAPENRRGRRSRRPSARGATQVAVLLVGPDDLTWVTDCSPIYSAVIHGVQQALAERDIDLVVRHAPLYAQLAAILRTHRADGSIIFGSEPADALPDELRAAPAVWMMGSPRRFTGDWVAPHHARIGLLAAEHLHAAGHRDCAFLGGDLSGPGAALFAPAQRGFAFCAALRERGGRVAEVPQEGLYDHRRNRPNYEILAQRLDRLFASPTPPSALFLAMDCYAPGVYRWLADRRLRPGRDVAVVSCNNERPFLAGLEPAPIGIDIQPARIGRRAVERLLWRLAHPDEPGEAILVSPSLVVG